MTLPSGSRACKRSPITTVGRLHSLPEAELDPLAERLGDLPLALDLAGRYLAEEEDFSPGDYLEELKKQERSFLEHESLREEQGYSPTGHSTSLQATFRQSWEKVKDEQGQRIFRTCGYCAANVPIPEGILSGAAAERKSERKSHHPFRPTLYGVIRLGLKILRGSAKERVSESGPEADWQRPFRRCMNRLYNLGLLKRSPGGPSMHPLLAEFARRRDREAAESSLPGLVKSLSELAGKANNSGFPQQFLPFLTHVRAAAGAAREAGQLEEPARLWNNLGYHFDMVGEYAAARPYYEQALAIRREALGEKHPDTANSLNNLGFLLKAMGETAAARPYLEQALEIYRAIGDPGAERVEEWLKGLEGKKE